MMSKAFAGEHLSPTSFTKNVCDQIAQILDVNPSNDYIRPDGKTVSVGEEIFQRMNWIELIFKHPKSFNQSVGPAKIRDRVEQHHRKVLEALNVLKSLSGPILMDPAEDLIDRIIKKRIYEASDVSPALSAGLVSYDTALDKNFSDAAFSLEKVEGYLANIMEKASSSVLKQGDNKPGNPFADSMLACLCLLYRDITGEIPKAYISDTEIHAIAKGRIIKFLVYVLELLPYPYKVNGIALEGQLSSLKSDETYNWAWKDRNEVI